MVKCVDGRGCASDPVWELIQRFSDPLAGRKVKIKGREGTKEKGREENGREGMGIR